MKFESENTEYKKQIDENVYKAVIAFANTGGGIICVGVDDSGNAIGFDDVDESYTKLTNGIRDAIVPDVTIFTKYSLEDNATIKVAVAEGSAKPYYLRSKGLKPSGVYIRQGASSVQASHEQIRAMIKEADGDVYEEMRSLEQVLTFSDTEKTFKENKVDFSSEKFLALGITNSGLFTNLALLLSDQCSHTIKTAVFADEANTVFKDSKEFGGSIFAQLNDAFSYLRLCNRNAAVIEGLKRTEHYDYPEEALREALLNAIVHRDYSYSGSVIINVNDKEIEFISLGGLLPGLSAEDIKSGISQPRNRNLAEIFHRLRLIESYGTGIRRIFNLYKDCSAQPRLEITPNAFKIVLPNMNYAGNVIESTNKKKLSPQKQKILDYLSANGKINAAKIEELLGVKRTRAFVISKQLCDDGYIECVGRGEGKYFTLRR